MVIIPPKLLSSMLQAFYRMAEPSSVSSIRGDSKHSDREENSDEQEEYANDLKETKNVRSDLVQISKRISTATYIQYKQTCSSLWNNNDTNYVYMGANSASNSSLASDLSYSSQSSILLPTVDIIPPSPRSNSPTTILPELLSSPVNHEPIQKVEQKNKQLPLASRTNDQLGDAAISQLKKRRDIFKNKGKRE